MYKFSSTFFEYFLIFMFLNTNEEELRLEFLVFVSVAEILTFKKGVFLRCFLAFSGVSEGI